MDKLKYRDNESKKKLDRRLKTIEGQIRGIINMVEQDRYCYDILIQISAVNKSLKSLSDIILKEHLSTCVKNAIKEDNLDIIDEFMDMVKRVNL